MEESEEEILQLISSLRNLGVEIPSNITSIKQLDSSSFFSISSQSLQLLSHNTNTSSFPTSLPISMAEKLQSCNEMASFFQLLGYPFEITFHQFLYPSEEDLCKLVRFLVERLSELSEAKKTVNFVDNVRPKTLESNAQPISQSSPEKISESLVDLNNQNVSARLQDVRLEGDVPVSSSSSAEVPLLESNHGEHGAVGYVGDLKKMAAQVEGTAVITETCKPEQNAVSCEDFSPQLRCKVENICGQETVFPENATGEDARSRNLQEEHEFFEAAVRMALDNEHSFSSYIDQFNEQIAARKGTLQDLENQWNNERKSLEDKKWNLLESLCVSKPDCHLKLQKLKEIDREMHFVLSEIRKREEDCSKLAGDLEKQPEVASRKSYIQRITEITKNSRKLDTDVERIIKETRELKLESNSIEERLHRTYAVVDETIFREAKKDPVGRQAYRLLTNIHESFENIREQILDADKAQREVAELDLKLSVFASRSLDKDKLQADLDAMRRENEHIKKTLLI